MSTSAGLPVIMESAMAADIDESVLLRYYELIVTET